MTQQLMQGAQQLAGQAPRHITCKADRPTGCRLAGQENDPQLDPQLQRASGLMGLLLWCLERSVPSWQLLLLPCHPSSALLLLLLLLHPVVLGHLKLLQSLTPFPINMH